MPGVVPLVAFAGACGATGAVFLLARRREYTDPTRLLLSGLVLNAFFSAVILISFALSRQSDLTAALRWMMGTLFGATWSDVALLGVLLVVAMAVLAAIANDLRMLAFGEDDAKSRGVNVERVKLIGFVAASIVTGAAVAVSGIIGFVGLLVPHLIRLIWRRDFRFLLPLCALGGGDARRARRPSRRASSSPRPSCRSARSPRSSAFRSSSRCCGGTADARRSRVVVRVRRSATRCATSPRRSTRTQLVALAGPNGSGKSTLLKLVARVLAPHAGEIAFDGKRLRDWPPKEYAKQVALSAAGSRSRVSDARASTSSSPAARRFSAASPGSARATTTRRSGRSRSAMPRTSATAISTR